MKANELRIGNYVIYDNEVYQIDTIADVFPTLNTDKFGIGVVDWNNIKPVPLTEEWLIKFGFDKFHKMDWSIDGECSNDIKHSIWITTYFEKPLVRINDLDLPSIKYVHQLQNLFFALIQKELTL